MQLNFNKIKEALLLNELSGNTNAGLRLSWAGNTNSGISFGLHQIDTKHNSLGFQLLRKWGVTEDQIEAIKLFNANPSQSRFKTFKTTEACKCIECKLRENEKEITELYDSTLLNYIKYLKSIKINDLPIKDEATVVQLIDYHNQFNLSNNGKMHCWLKQQTEIDSEKILNFKLTQLKWGKSKQGQADINRRFKNVESLDYKVNAIEF